MFESQQRHFVNVPVMALTMMWLAACTLQPVSPVSPVSPVASQPPIVATLAATTQPLLGGHLSSPDGKWRAEVEIYVCTEIEDQGEISYERLSLIDIATDEQTEIAHQQINCGGLGAFGLAPLCWSADSQVLYFTDAREGVPDGTGEWQRPILQFDGTTGQTQPYTGEAKPLGSRQQPYPVECR